MTPRKTRSQAAADPLAAFPPWARQLAERYFTKTISTFILHGAVRDLQPAADDKGGKRFVTLRTFLSDELFGTRDLVVRKPVKPALPAWRMALFAFLYRNSVKVVDRFNLTPENVVEIARQIEI